MSDQPLKGLLFRFLDKQFTENEQLKKDLEETREELRKLREEHADRLFELGGCKRKIEQLSKGVCRLATQLKTNQDLWKSLAAKKPIDRMEMIRSPVVLASFGRIPLPSDPEVLVDSIAVDATAYITRLCGIKN